MRPATKGASGETDQGRRLGFKRIGQAGSTVALIGGIVAVVFIFVPGLRPGSGSAKSAKLELLHVNERATLREGLDAEGIPFGSLSRATLRRLGVLTTIRYTSSGLGRKLLPLVVSLTSRETGDIVCRHRAAVGAGGGLPVTISVWTPFPVHPRAANDTYSLRVALFSSSGLPPSLGAADRDGIPAPSAGPAAPLPNDLC